MERERADVAELLRNCLASARERHPGYTVHEVWFGAADFERLKTYAWGEA